MGDPATVTALEGPGAGLKDLTSLRVFARVVELQSFSEVARRMGITPATVSKHVASLELTLRARLVNRTTRKLYVTSLTAKSPTPDVFAIDVIWAGEFAQRGWLAPLDDLLGADTLATYNQSLLKGAQINGQTFAVPLYVDGTHLFYRTDLLKKYNLEVPKTWEEVIADSKTIMKGENNPQFYGFVSMWAKIEGQFMNWLSFTNGNGGGFSDADGKVAVNSPANIAATQAMVALSG